VWTLTGVWTGQLLMIEDERGEAATAHLGDGVLVRRGTRSRPVDSDDQAALHLSFVLYSLGWVLFMLIGFFVVIELLGNRWWTLPLVVFGANSIFIYSFNMVLREWLDHAVGVFTFHYGGIGTLAPVAQACTVLAVLWSLCYWMYRRRIFVKV
jgi:predicted acyltransferase